MLRSYAVALRALVFLVVAGTCCAQDAPRISVIGDEARDHSDATAAALAAAGGKGGDAMQDMLNWAIQHSDPERLKELMLKYQENNLTIKDVYGQDMIDALFVNEGSVIKDMSLQIVDFANASVTDDDLDAAINRLMELVEQVDNAGNLHRNGGLQPLLELGVSGPLVGSKPHQVERSEHVRSLALWTLGVATQNNAPVQEDLLAIGGLPMLMGRLPLCTPTANQLKEVEVVGSEYCAKLIFAISGLVKNNETIQAAAEAHGLFNWLLDAGIGHPSPGVAKKAMGLLDITLAQSPDLQVLNTLPARQNAIARALLLHIHSADSDAAEKSVRLVNRLLSLRPMLFESSFQSDFTKAVASAMKDCERLHGVGDELCTGLSALAEHASIALAARNLSDEDL